MWSAFVSALERLLHGTGDALGGSLALGIFVTVLVIRILLIPIMLPLARRTREHQRVAGMLKPRIKELSRELKDEPGKLNRELKALHQEAGIGMIDKAGLLGALIQVPILIALFQAVFHVSQETGLASGGLLLGVVAGAVSVLGTVLGGQGGPVLLAISGILPIGIGAWLGAGIGWYLLAFYSGSLLQSLLMRDGPAITGES
ncbi:MAG: YidC/Oxa1 family membrane protein insertase [Gemmatimonadota bacterium]